MARDALSSTKLVMLRECPRAFRERYVEGKKGRATHGKRRGSLVHVCLERAGKARVGENRTHAGPATLEELLSYLDHYTSRASYPAEVVREAREVLELCAPLDLSHVRHVEEEWRLSARDGRTCTTKIDRADYHDTYEDAERGMLGPTVLIHDYKTHGSVSTRAELRDEPQTLLYLAAMKERYPDENVGLVFDYIRRGVSHAPIWWSEDLDRQARGLIEEALEEIDRRSNGLDSWGEISPDPWPATAGKHCLDCPYQSGCDGYAEYLRSGDSAAPDPALMPNEQLVLEYVRSRDACTLNEDRKRACGAELRERIGQGNGKELAAADLRAKLVTTTDNLLDATAAAQEIAAVQVENGLLAESDFDARVAEIVEQIAPREISTRKLSDFLAKFPAALRSDMKKRIEAVKIPVDAGSYVRVENFKTLFDVGGDS